MKKYLTQTIKTIKKNIVAPHGTMGKLTLVGEKGLQRFEDDSLQAISRTAVIDVTSNVSLEPFCMIGHDVMIHSHDHFIPKEGNMLLYAEENPDKYIIKFDKYISTGVWIFSNAVILPKCNFIAPGVVIGNSSIVTKPIKEPYSIWAGNPAKLIKYRSQI